MDKKPDLLKIFLSFLAAVLLLSACASSPVKRSDAAKKKETSSLEEVFEAETNTKSYVDYDKQIEYFKNRLRTDPKNSELYYKLATLYHIQRKFKSSHFYIEKAKSFSTETRLTDKFRAFDRKIEGDFYRFAKLKNEIAVYEDFLKTFPESFYLDNVDGELEKLKYTEAVEKNSDDLFREYLRRYPHTKHYKAIKYRLDEIAWEDVLSVNTVKAYQQFLIDNPFTSFKEPALKRIDRLRFNPVKKIDTIEAYGGFIQKYPANQYIEEAKERIMALQFAKVEKSGKIEEYEEYVKENPSGLFFDASLEKIDKLKYKKAVEIDTIEAIADFIENNPESKYVYQARRLLDAMRYEDVEKKDTLESYETFLQNHPGSQYRHDAMERIDAINKSKKISELCDNGEKAVKESDYETAIEAYTEALSLEYSSRALFGIAKLYELLGDNENDYDDKIGYYYKSSAAFKVIQRKDPEHKDVDSALDELLGKKSAEQKIMNDARTRKHDLPELFNANLITYSKNPVLVIANTGRESTISVDILYNNGKEKKSLEVTPLSEIKRLFNPGAIDLNLKGSELDTNFSLELFPYYEYILRVK